MDLVSFIEDAQEIDIKFTDLPFTIKGFFTLLEFPSISPSERLTDEYDVSAIQRCEYPSSRIRAS